MDTSNLLHRTSSAPGMFMPTLEERTYEGNRLEADLTNGVSYDACGRYTGSSGSVVSTSYNEIGLPLEMTLSDCSVVRTVYAADGRKLRETTVLSGTSATRSYSGSCIFEGNTLKKVLFEGGYAQMSGSTPSYMFFLTDHLGSVRVVANQSGSVSQVNQYSPFGDLMSDPRLTAGNQDNRYRFTGKERSAETLLHDFGARYLDSSIGRFTTIDPLAEKYPAISPYAYCAGDPVNLVDGDGRASGDYYDSFGKYLGNDGVDDNKVYRLRYNYPSNTNNSDINWGGTLSREIYSNLQSISDYIGNIQEVFVTGDAISNKRILQLHPAIRMLVTDFINEANSGNSETIIRVSQGLRTYAEQDELYSIGRTQPGNIVTKAQGGYSIHNFGLAFDIVGITNGKLDYNLDWEALSKLGKSKGFDWGGDWKSIVDKPHFENSFGNTLSQLRNASKDKNGFPIIKP